MTVPEPGVAPTEEQETARVASLQEGVDGGQGWTVQNAEVHPGSDNPGLEQAVQDAHAIQLAAQADDEPVTESTMPGIS
jgi:hypothetical protein